MTWEDRIQEAAYTSPEGTRLTFEYEDVSRSISKKTKAFDFSDADGTYIQDLGKTGRKYPLRLIMWGADHDTQATAFEDALLERGTGVLEHPIYGTINVVPFGNINRRDDLKTAANQSIIEVTFWETIDLIYPSSQQSPASEVLESIDTFNEASSDQFATNTNFSTQVKKDSFIDGFKRKLNDTKSGLRNIANTSEKVFRQFNNIFDSIDSSVGELLNIPGTLAFQTMLLIHAPARAIASIRDRLSAFGNLMSSLISGDNATASPGTDVSGDSLSAAAELNGFYRNDLYATGYVTGSVLSAVNTQFETKTDALEAADDILTQLESVISWRDTNFQNLGLVDTGEVHQALTNSVYLLAGFLVEISFTLKQERSIILDRARTIIDLVAELYGSVDDNLDFFINSNNLTGSEILELPRGKRIVYYI